MLILATACWRTCSPKEPRDTRVFPVKTNLAEETLEQPRSSQIAQNASHHSNSIFLPMFYLSESLSAALLPPPTNFHCHIMTAFLVLSSCSFLQTCNLALSIILFDSFPQIVSFRSYWSVSTAIYIRPQYLFLLRHDLLCDAQRNSTSSYFNLVSLLKQKLIVSPLKHLLPDEYAALSIVFPFPVSSKASYKRNYAFLGRVPVKFLPLTLSVLLSSKPSPSRICVYQTLSMGRGTFLLNCNISQSMIRRAISDSGQPSPNGEPSPARNSPPLANTRLTSNSLNYSSGGNTLDVVGCLSETPSNHLWIKREIPQPHVGFIPRQQPKAASLRRDFDHHHSFFGNIEEFQGMKNDADRGGASTKVFHIRPDFTTFVQESGERLTQNVNPVPVFYYQYLNPGAGRRGLEPFSFPEEQSWRYNDFATENLKVTHVAETLDIRLAYNDTIPIYQTVQASVGNFGNLPLTLNGKSTMSPTHAMNILQYWPSSMSAGLQLPSTSLFYVYKLEYRYCCKPRDGISTTWTRRKIPYQSWIKCITSLGRTPTRKSFTKKYGTQWTLADYFESQDLEVVEKQPLKIKFVGNTNTTMIKAGGSVSHGRAARAWYTGGNQRSYLSAETDRKIETQKAESGVLCLNPQKGSEYANHSPISRMNTKLFEIRGIGDMKISCKSKTRQLYQHRTF
ncbi:uncharacterized protein BDR25DRAFT_355907 [Lindgomyces ingoldianus]|uniref:Uncharacterized protein n=1 Tax=Lindgomyces ingoldianus TaxID=673940 RepID=A0ACB6QT81_9PLEO|nr:uncharacterized protein BDR25DRAFT_355907 [Lindgomyces ingoldianus]KAF2470204.1 hypothetical protein BDR25DRAFT_355907 [Lindgomyces ingoldianus]